MERETILAGGSAGGVVAALERVHHDLAPRSVCIVCDRGERYLDTILNDEWVEAHCGSSVSEEPGGGRLLRPVIEGAS